MEEDKRVITPEEQTESEVTNTILKPSIPSEELVNKNIDHKKELNTKIERYNYNQGFRKTNNGPSLVLKETKKPEPTSNEKITIKMSKKNNKLPLIIIVIAILLIGGFLIFSNSLNKPKTPTVPPVVETPPEVVIETTSNKCTKRVESTIAEFNTITEYELISIDNKLQKTTNLRILEFSTTPSELYTNACTNYQGLYKGYGGYINTCLIEGNNIIYKTEVDLTILKDKELIFNINDQETTIKIGENLDDDINPIIEKYSNSGYTCDN